MRVYMRGLKLRKLSDESGMVSIMVTMILIIVMTLIVLAMSQDSTRQQRQTLDRQLSDQAFYNAESGINDWKDYLEKNSTAPTLPVDKKVCTNTGFSGPLPLPDSNITSADPNNQYTCVLYDRAPKTIEYSNLLPGDGRTVELVSKDGGRIETLTFGWNYNGLTNCAGITLASQLPANCSTAALEVVLIDSSPGPVSRASILNNSYIAYFLPSSTGVLTDNFNLRTGTDKQGGRVLAKCPVSATDNSCSMTINGINKDRVTLHLSTIYTSPGNIAISGKKADGSDISFIGAQIMIDSTGKSQDILRRVRVRVPSTNASSAIGLSALRTTNPICKLLTVDKGLRTAQLEPGPANCKTD